MNHIIKLFGLLLVASLAVTSCNKEDAGLGLTQELETTETELTLADILAPPVDRSTKVELRGKKQPRIWADCEGFDTRLTTANFKPSAGNFDKLYNMAVFKNGLGAISESKPGDRDYNGGRWEVLSLKPGIDKYKYADACSVEDIDTDDFESTGIYFECPLLPIND